MVVVKDEENIVIKSAKINTDNIRNAGIIDMVHFGQQKISIDQGGCITLSLKGTMNWGYYLPIMIRKCQP